MVADNVGNQHIATNANVAHTAFGAHWTFDEASGSAADSTGNGHTATLQAGATRTAGKVGTNALNLTGGSTQLREHAGAGDRHEPELHGGRVGATEHPGVGRPGPPSPWTAARSAPST